MYARTMTQRKESSLLSDFIALKSDSFQSHPLHQQLYLKVREGIMEGALRADSRLPSSRALARELQLSRNTVMSAYEQLMAEGFLETRKGSGTYISDIAFGADAAEAPKITAPAAAKRLASLASSATFAGGPGGLPLLPGLIDPELFPYRQWNSIYQRANRALDEVFPQFSLQNGYLPLCRAIARHVAVTRDVKAKPSQVFITAGAAQSLALISHTLTNPGDRVWMEDPGYPLASGAFKLADLALSFIPIDRHGLIPPIKISEHGAPKLTYLTTSYQFPLGYTMPIKRRLEILEIANRSGGWIIEDDYDGEFRYRGKPIPAMFSLKNNQSTIYMGTFSKSLSPALRVSFIIVPPALVQHFQSVYPYFGNISAIATHAALAEFLSRGFFARNIALMRQAFGARKQVLEDTLYNGDPAYQKGGASPPGGLHVVAKLGGNASDVDIASELGKNGLGALPLSTHFNVKKEANLNGFLLGFTAVDEHTVSRSIEKLKDIVEHNHCTLAPVNAP